MSDIDIGPASIKRATSRGGGNTDINYTNPANLSGNIKLITVYSYNSTEAIEGLKVGIFYLVSDAVFHCRSAASLGTAAGHANVTFNVSLPVQQGDYLGYYFNANTGQIELDNAAGVGLYYKSGDYVTVDSQATYTFVDKYTTSCHGAGDDLTAGSLIAITPYMMF